MSSEYERLKNALRQLYPRGYTPSREQRIDWAYNNAKLSNPNVTKQMIEEAVDRMSQKKDDYLRNLAEWHRQGFEHQALAEERLRRRVSELEHLSTWTSLLLCSVGLGTAFGAAVQAFFPIALGAVFGFVVGLNNFLSWLTYRLGK